MKIPASRRVGDGKLSRLHRDGRVNHSAGGRDSAARERKNQKNSPDRKKNRAEERKGRGVKRARASFNVYTPRRDWAISQSQTRNCAWAKLKKTPCADYNSSPSLARSPNCGPGAGEREKKKVRGSIIPFEFIRLFRALVPPLMRGIRGRGDFAGAAEVLYAGGARESAASLLSSQLE